MMEYQDYVPLKRMENGRKVLMISVIISILIILIFGIVFLSLLIKKRTKQEFLETSIYYVCASRSKNKKELENMQDSVKEFGGAGKIYQKDEMFYLIISAYFDKDSAEVIVENNKSIYENAQILELKTKKVSNKVVKRFKNNEINLRFLKKFNKDLNEIYNLQMQYLSGDITENDLCSKLLTLKFDNDDLIYEINKEIENEYRELVLNYANLKEMYFTSFFNNFFESDKKSSLICDFVVGLLLLKVDFFNNL